MKNCLITHRSTIYIIIYLFSYPKTQHWTVLMALLSPTSWTPYKYGLKWQLFRSSESLLIRWIHWSNWRDGNRAKGIHRLEVYLKRVRKDHHPTGSWCHWRCNFQPEDQDGRNDVELSRKSAISMSKLLSQELRGQRYRRNCPRNLHRQRRYSQRKNRLSLVHLGMDIASADYRCANRKLRLELARSL